MNTMGCMFHDLGLMDYKEAWQYQENLHASVLLAINSGGKEAINHLVFCEHPHVFTLGKSGVENNLLVNNDFLDKINASFCKTNRGGDITYHGPGQVVGYPIFIFEHLGIGVKKYISLLEQSIIDTLAYFGIAAGLLEGATGVWLEDSRPAGTRKICAIGVRVSRSVTMHGFALNVNTDLSYFGYINPCGFQDKGVTSMEKELGQKVDMGNVKQILLQNLSRLFKIEMIKEQKNI